MADLDAAIRADLREAPRVEFGYGEWVRAEDFDEVSEALRAVLDHIGQCEFFADELEGDDLRQVIAQELGVKP